MKQRLRFFDSVSQKTRALLLVILAVIVAGSIIAACGKLSDDSERPYTPTGSSSGQTLPMAPPSALGDFRLTLRADDDRVPADGVTFTQLHAKLWNSAGQSVENFEITFDTSPTSDAIGLFLNPATTTGSGSPATTTIARTDADGSVSVRLYGVLSGSCTPQAKVDVNNDNAEDLFITTTVIFTPAGPPDSAGSYRLLLSAEPSTIPGDAGTASVITAQLLDSSGGSVQNFTIKFEDMTKFGGFEGGGETGTTGTVGPTTYEGTTGSDGKVSVRYYGDTPGVALIRASVHVGDLGGGPGTPGIGELINTVRVTIFEVIIPNPAIILESPGDAVVSQTRITGDTYTYTWSSTTLDAILRVEDGNGNRIGGVTLAFSIINQTGCGGVKFSQIFGTATTNISGRAIVTTQVTGTGATVAPNHCQYDLEIMYDGELYVLSPGGQVKACPWNNPDC